MRRKASVWGVRGSWIAMSWSKRERGSAAMARASAGATFSFVPRKSTITISLPRPFILRNRRFASALITAAILAKAVFSASREPLASKAGPNQPMSLVRATPLGLTTGALMVAGWKVFSVVLVLGLGTDEGALAQTA